MRRCFAHKKLLFLGSSCIIRVWPLEAVHLRHHQVEQNQVRFTLLQTLQCCSTAPAQRTEPAPQPWGQANNKKPRQGGARWNKGNYVGIVKSAHPSQSTGNGVRIAAVSHYGPEKGPGAKAKPRQSIPRNETAVIRHFQERMPYGLFVRNCPSIGKSRTARNPFCRAREW
jgi:hypothetical protein